MLTTKVNDLPIVRIL